MKILIGLLLLLNMTKVFATSQFDVEEWLGATFPGDIRTFIRNLLDESELLPSRSHGQEIGYIARIPLAHLGDFFRGLAEQESDLDYSRLFDT